METLFVTNVKNQNVIDFIQYNFIVQMEYKYYVILHIITLYTSTMSKYFTPISYKYNGPIITLCNIQLCIIYTLIKHMN